jgi:hypothetical protein
MTTLTAPRRPVHTATVGTAIQRPAGEQPAGDPGGVATADALLHRRDALPDAHPDRKTIRTLHAELTAPTTP